MNQDPSIPNVPFIYLRRAGIYLEVLGWLQLLSLNLGGILLIVAGQKIRKRDKTWWWVAVVICALSAAAAVLVGAAGLMGAPGFNVRFAGRPLENSERWIVLCTAGFFCAIFGLPLFWLLAPATRRAIWPNPKSQCVNCGYDIRANCDRCPECGFAIAPKTTEEYARLLRQVR